MSELKEQEHITKEMFDCWQQGSMENEQEAKFLEHVGKCTFCAEKFGNWMEDDLIEPPSYLKEEISRRTRQLDVQTVVKARRTSKRVQLWMYSLRVGLAVAASIFLLMVTGSVQNMNMELPKKQQNSIEELEKKESLTDKLNNGSSFITDSLNQMTDGLFQLEWENKRE